jgi:dipeptidyl aminopeptidase/acylaminoacyl peptidase
MRACCLALALGLLPSHAFAETRPLKVDDLFALREVADPRISPDGRWVAYTVKTLDPKEDAADTDIFMASLAGGEALRLTASRKAETHPRWSPDGKYLAFLSARGERDDKDGESEDKARTQVWLLPRAGGEAIRLTDYKASVSDLAWSPDGSRLALVVSDVDPDEASEMSDDAAGKPKTEKPIVIRRLQFKRDGEGYLREVRSHVHVFDVAKKTSVQITSGPFDDSEPVWSPDGRQVAFVSNRTLPDADRSQNADVFVVTAREGQVPRALATTPGTDHSPAFSPDGTWIAYVAGCDPKDLDYGASHVAVVPTEGGPSRPLTASLDRNVFSPRFAPDGQSVLFVVEDGGNQHLARVPFGGGAVERVVAGEREVQAFDVGPKGDLVVLESSPWQPAEVSAVSGGGLARLTTVNDAFLKGIRLGRVERFKAASADRTLIDGFLTLPPDYEPGTRLPAILRIHGGPAWLFTTTFEFQWQVLAAQGYAVIASNPRGSTGYGTAFSRAIWADWGNKDYQDVMAAVDHVIAMGVADPARLGVGGWSYGGILTDYVISKTARFKAAISGAGEANFLADYGTDHYQYEYEVELGLPWKTRDLWLRLSSPFFDVEKITTPTLFLCGSLDMNVPLLSSEQIYQAVRRVGKVDTELVIYPGEWHDIEAPSHQKDRIERYVAWYNRYLKPGAVTGERTPEATSLLGRPLYALEPAALARKGLEEALTKATADFVKRPDSADAAIALGRSNASLGRFREAIDIYTRALARNPTDARLYRYRGHRYITVRELDKAIADLTKASRLVAGKADVPEPEASVPGGPPTSTVQFAIWYHLGLARYLKGDFAAAVAAYRECLKASQGSDDRLVAATDWLYMALRRAGRGEEAARALEGIRPVMKVVQNHAYLNRLLMYKGLLAPDDLLRAGGNDLDAPTLGYAVGNWYLYNGQREKAKEVFAGTVKGPCWPAFGFVASEAELVRMR